MASGERDLIDPETLWSAFVEAAFKAAGLPEVPADQLEIGTYTNAQIAERFRKNLLGFIAVLQNLPEGDNASRRSILSFAAEMMDEESPQVP
ncbi:MAG TPA: hypothetical protein VMW04_03315 [Patescibacteria group bacterium]|nr:hypothetical protein [Patescibacteria group bacterium]